MSRLGRPDRPGIEKIIAQDPFLRTGAVTYEVIEIEPTRSAVPELTAPHESRY